MKNLTEIVKRPNVHQTHFCDLVLLGTEGLEELNDKIDRFLQTKQNKDVGLNVSTKIDGCLHPDTIIKTTEGDKTFSEIILNRNHTYYGYGKDSDGNIKEVELKFPRVSSNNNKDWYNFKFENGSNIICTQNHPFSVNGTYIIAENLKCGDDVDTLD